MSEIEKTIANLLRAIRPGSSRPRSRSQSVGGGGDNPGRVRTRSRSVPLRSSRPLTPEITVLDSWTKDQDQDKDYETTEETDIVDDPIVINKVTKLVKKKPVQKERGRSKSRSIERSISQAIAKSRSRSRSKQPAHRPTDNIDRETFTKLKELVDELTTKINKVTVNKERPDCNIGNMTDECLHVQTGPENLEPSRGINPQRVSNALKFARAAGIKYEPKSGMREFIVNAQSAFDHWRLNSAEFITILLTILPTQFQKALRSIDKGTIPINTFYQKLMAISGDGELLAERKRRFYNMTCAESTDLLDLVTKLEAQAQAIFEEGGLRKEVYQQLMSILPLKYREDLQRYLQNVNRDKSHMDEFVYPAPFETLKILYGSTPEINKYIKSLDHRNIPKVKALHEFGGQNEGKQFVKKETLQCKTCKKPGHLSVDCYRNTSCILCGGINHKAPTCRYYPRETVVQTACEDCLGQFGKKLFHSNSSCKVKSFL